MLPSAASFGDLEMQLPFNNQIAEGNFQNPRHSRHPRSKKNPRHLRHPRSKKIRVTCVIRVPKKIRVTSVIRVPKKIHVTSVIRIPKKIRVTSVIRVPQKNPRSTTRRYTPIEILHYLQLVLSFKIPNIRYLCPPFSTIYYSTGHTTSL
ncbi:MAG: hypothetical protein JNN28_05350 [Saprospiraceae bacterium]|nr:hypothetical protein [Saprospiraceae bacterium]